MAQGDPTKWKYFEEMNVVEFLQMCLYFKEKQEDLKQQQRLLKNR